MKRYYLILAILTVVLTVVGWWIQYACLDSRYPIFLAIPVYFGIVTGLQHFTATTSLRKSPRIFIKNFLGTIVGSLLIHLIILSLWAFTHIPTAKPFIIAFGIAFVIYLIYETLMLVLLVKGKK